MPSPHRRSSDVQGPWVTSPELKRDVATRTLRALDAVTPGILELQVDAVAAGVVVAWGELDIDHEASALHQRDAIGVDDHGGYLSVNTGKFTTAPLFAPTRCRPAGFVTQMAPTRSTTITVAIPLHASARWIGNVEQNVRALPLAVTEIILSDRTCLDNAAEQLSERRGDDPRVTVIAEPAGLEWEEHYQLLLEEATGELFMWMPHDDIFEASWIPTLAAELVKHPRGWLAFGRVIPVLEDGRSPHPTHPRLLTGGTRELIGLGAARLAFRGTSWVAFRGLLRRNAVLESGFRIERTSEIRDSDNYWVLKVALKSYLVFSADTSTRKRFHSGSASTTWKYATRGSGHRETLAILRAYGPGGPQGIAMRMETRGHSALRFARRPFRSHPQN